MKSLTSFASRRVNPGTGATPRDAQTRRRLRTAAPQFGIELDDVTTEKQIQRKEHHKDDEVVGEDEEARP